MYLYTDECLNSFPGVKLSTQTYINKVTSCNRRNLPMENKINIKVQSNRIMYTNVPFIHFKESKIYIKYNAAQTGVQHSKCTCILSLSMEEGTQCQN